jgi:hypothetical protein
MLLTVGLLDQARKRQREFCVELGVETITVWLL